LSSNALEIWKAAQAETAIPECQQLEQTLNCLVWRHGLTCQFRTLDPLEAAALQLMVRDQLSFADLCNALFKTAGEQAPIHAATWLKQWISEELLIRTGATAPSE
jgi:hypothetical protein